MSILTDALPGILVPAVACGGCALAARPWRPAEASPRRSWALALGIAVGYSAGHRVVTGNWAPVPFRDTTLSAQQWRMYAGVVAALFGIVVALRQLPASAVLGLRAGLLALVLRATLDARFRHTWSAWEGAWRVGLLVLAALVVWWGLERRAARRGVSASIELWFVATGTAIAFQIARASSNAQLAGALAATLGAAAVACALWPRIGLAPGGTWVVVALLAAMLVEGPVYGEVPVLAAILIGSAPLVRALVMHWIRPTDAPEADSPRLELLIVGLTTAAGVVAAVLLTPERLPYMPG